MITWFDKEVRIAHGGGTPMASISSEYLIVEECGTGDKHLAKAEELQATGGPEEITAARVEAAAQRAG